MIRKVLISQIKFSITQELILKFSIMIQSYPSIALKILVHPDTDFDHAHVKNI